MKAVILAGGLGTRISEETLLRPKPMIEIGGKPMLWHIMKTYSAHGINDFIICCGYKGYMIKEYFANYGLHMSDITVDLRSGNTTVNETSVEPWSITLVDTGENTMTGGRLKRVARYLAGEETFCFTYGDGVSNIDVTKLVAFHRERGLLATITAIQPPGRFGVLKLDRDLVTGFTEKPENGGAWINGGYFVLSTDVLEYIEDDATIWEREPLGHLTSRGQLAAYQHTGFWHPMDTLRDKNVLEELWANPSCPWRVWR